jgi:predicted dehydrogenase
MTPLNSHPDRREFLAMMAGATAGAVANWACPSRAYAADGRRWTAAVIGHTGRGDYGHGLDVAFKGVPGIEIVAVADPDAAGRAKAAERIGAPRQYADFRVMLEKEKPNLVSIAPRWTDDHHAMAMAALAVGAHLLTEKPFMQTLRQADEVLATADRAGKKIAVAHQMRLAPPIARLKRAIDEGAIGDLLQMDAWGKQDSRAGGEDMLVLGTHLFDLMRLFAGDARWCTARVLQGGRDITLSDAHPAGEGIGPIAGDEIVAQFGFDRGVNATFTSRGKQREAVGHWGIEFTGSKGSARILADMLPRVFVIKRNAWSDAGRSELWQPLASPEGAEAKDAESGNRRVVNDWLDAIDRNREPACSGRNATKAMEMVMAVYRAGLDATRVRLPLKERGHPLAS